MTKKEWFYLIVLPTLFAAEALCFIHYREDTVRRSDYEALQEKLAVAEDSAWKWESRAKLSRDRVIRDKHLFFDDFYLLAKLVESEAGGESYETKMMVASVVMNRVADDRFPDTIKNVVYQEGQFDVTELTVGGIPLIDAKEPSIDSMRAANDVLNQGSILPSNVLVFYQNGIDEPWVTSRTTHIISDNTVFAYMD